MFLSGEFGQRVLALNHSATSKEHGTKRPDDEATFISKAFPSFPEQGLL